MAEHLETETLVEDTARPGEEALHEEIRGMVFHNFLVTCKLKLGELFPKAALCHKLKEYKEVTGHRFKFSEEAAHIEDIDPPLDEYELLDIFKKIESFHISCSRPKSVHGGDVYIFANMNNSPYWQEDGKQWRMKIKRGHPHRESDSAKLRLTRYQLKSHGTEVAFFRNEFVPSIGKVALSENFVLVIYEGRTTVYEDAVSISHGNLGKPKSTKVKFAGRPAKQSFSPDTTKSGEPSDSSVQHEPLPAFYPTRKHVIQRVDEALKKGTKPGKIYSDLATQAVFPDSGSDSPSDRLKEIPRDKKQVYNRAAKKKREEEPYNNDLGDVLSLSRHHPTLVPFFSLTPGKSICVTSPVLLKHVKEMVRGNEIQLFYDTTYQIGLFFVSMLSLRHPLLEGHPTIPIAFLLHEFTDAETAHKPFFKQVSKLLPELNKAGARVAIITDREKSIKEAVGKKLKIAKHFFCYSHIIKNVQRFCRGKFPAADTRMLCKNMKLLLWSESLAEFDNTLSRFVPDEDASPLDVFDDIDEIGNSRLEEGTDENDDVWGDVLRDESPEKLFLPWPERFASYFMKFLKSDVRSTCRAEATKFNGLFSLQSGVTTNVAESANATLKTKVQPRSTHYDCIVEVNDWMNTIAADLLKAQKSIAGNFRVSSKPDLAKKWHKLEFVDPKGLGVDLRKITRQVVDLENTNFKLDVNRSAKLKQALKLVSDIHLDKENGFFLVIEKGQAFRVNFPHQLCSCSNKWCQHLLAVNMRLDVINKSTFSHLENTKPSTLTSVHNAAQHKTVGKKGPARQPQAIYATATAEKLEKFLDYDVKLPRATLNNRGKVYLRVGGIPLTLHDLKTLPEDIDEAELTELRKAAEGMTSGTGFTVGWLTDNVIDAYLHILCEADLLAAAIASTVVTSWMADGTEFPKTPKLGKIFRLLIPRYIENHWTAVYVDKNHKLVLCYDPSDSQWEIRGKEKTKLLAALSNIWPEIKNWVVCADSALQQTDAQNCGPLILLYFERRLTGKSREDYADLSAYRMHVLSKLQGEACSVELSEQLGDTLCRVCQKDEAPRKKEGSTNDTWIQCERCEIWAHRACLTYIRDGETPGPEERYVCRKL